MPEPWRPLVAQLQQDLLEVRARLQNVQEIQGRLRAVETEQQRRTMVERADRYSPSCPQCPHCQAKAQVFPPVFPGPMIRPAVIHGPGGG